MKKLYYIFLLFIPMGVSAQVTITSVQNGNASNPLTWDCLCFPSTDDNIVINHNVAMDVDWLVNNGGSITVNSGGSLLQNGTHALAIDGGGTELNVSGQFKMQNLSVTGGAAVQTTASGTIRIVEGIYVGNTASYTNAGSTLEVDSLLTEGLFQQNGILMAGDVLNTGDFTLAGEMTADSVGNTGAMTFTSGYTYCTAFGTSGTAVLSSGFIHTDGNMYNSGDFTTSSGTLLECLGSFYSGDTIMGTALLDMNGLLTVATDLYFSEDVQGSGDICVSGDSYNAAAVTGTLDICDATATLSGFDYNMGTVAGSITFCSPGCSVSVDEEIVAWNIAPNPSNDKIKLIGVVDVKQIQVIDLSGSTAAIIDNVNNTFDVSGLQSGAYFVILVGAKNTLPVRLIVN